MRILFVNQYFPPDEAATAQILGDLVEAAVRAGLECRVVTSDRGYADPTQRFARRETWKGAGVERVRSTGFGRGPTVGRVLDYMTFLVAAGLRLLRGPRPDVVVGLSTPPILGALAILVARLRGARAGYWAMDVYPDVAFALGVLSRNSISGRALSLLSAWTIRRADLVVALGDTMAGRLRSHGARRIAVVHNWTDDAAVRPIVPLESAYRTARGWGTQFVVAYSGNMGLAHEFDTLLGAAAKLASEQIRFAFIGHGPRREEVAAAVKARGLGNVEFLPAVPRATLGDALAAADVHVVTLRGGMQGLLVPSKIYGILAAGRPTIYVGPAEGEVFEILTRGRCGAVIREGNGKELADVILAYRTDRARWTRESIAAREVLDANFRKDRQTAALVAELSKLAAERPRGLS